MKYKIMHDYGSYEGYKFVDEIEFDDVDTAVKHAVAMHYLVPFIIVSVHWKPEYIKN